MSWNDPNVPMPSEGYGKFELSVHSNDCFTAAGPSKLVGFLDITDTKGHDVTNPVFEFDGCFDPGANDSKTGVLFPSVLNVTSTTVSLDAQRRPGLQVSCGTGSEGCSGSVTAKAGNADLATVPYTLKEESTKTLRFTTPLPVGAKETTFQVTPKTGTGSRDPVTLPLR
jgi:hypothetical protein